MYKNRTELLRMVRRYLDGKATAEEKKFLEAYDQFFEKDPDVLKSLNKDEKKLLGNQLESGIWSIIEQEEEKNIKPLWPSILKIAAAACIILGVGFGSYLYLHQRPARLLAHQQPEQIDPVQKGIVLTLAKGQQILLGQKHQGQIAAVNGAKITQLDSLLNYAAAAKTMAGSQAENTLTNHTGKSFSLILADGTEAILDAASSITYPAAFSGNERRVSITGQVYFIVKHNPLQPFKVFFKNEEADDIGTEFNINAYDDEDAVKTTLISGAVRIRLNHSSTGGLLLKPGEQTIANGNDIHVAEANIEEATAWLQGKLVFHHETLENILRQVARIYDVQIVWQDESARKLTFGGSVSRTKKLSTILNYFRNAGQVDFIVEGKTVKVFKRKNN